MTLHEEGVGRHLQEYVPPDAKSARHAPAGRLVLSLLSPQSGECKGPKVCDACHSFIWYWYDDSMLCTVQMPYSCCMIL